MGAPRNPGLVCALLAAVAMSVSSAVLAMSGYTDPSLHLIVFVASVGGALFLLTLYYAWREFQERFDDMINRRGGGPNGPHPIPANDSWFLNRKESLRQQLA